MTKDPWTDSNPQSGDFDAEIAALDPRLVEAHDGDSKSMLRLVVSVRGEDARRLERIAEARGQKPDEALSDLLRAADRSSA